jgi:uridylate kinase
VTDPDAQRFDRLSYRDVLERDLKVMDATAIAHARENGIPILVFSLHNAGALIDVAQGKGDCTVISDGG